MALILFVENDQTFGETGCDLLKRCGYRCLRAITPVQAEASLKSHQIDAAIIDVRLRDEEDREDWSGLTLARTVAERGIPVIILSAYDTKEDIDRAFDVAPDVPPPYGFVSKNRPDWSKCLTQMLEEALSEKKKSWWRKGIDFVGAWGGTMIKIIKSLFSR